MVVAFCGHARFCKREEYEQKILAFLEEKIGERIADMYLGGYGEFDSFAYECCKKYKDMHPNVSLVFVTPYLDIEYQRNHLQNKRKKFDVIFYPEIENKPLRFAIFYRNRYMVDKADYIIAYVEHDWGGAYTTYRYAKRKGKEIFNLGTLQE